jgi:hypothetical protein
VELQYKLNGSEGKFSSLRTVQRKKWSWLWGTQHSKHITSGAGGIRPVILCAMGGRRKWKSHGAAGFVVYTCKQYRLSLCHFNCFLISWPNKDGKTVLHNVVPRIPSNGVYNLLSLIVTGL